ncbi:MAG: hypothetical protein ACNY01_10265 [Desulfobacteria bacterium]|jgi:hypothetical protein
MWKDPIVTEVRKRGEQLAEEAGGDIHKFFDMLRSAQNKYASRLTNVKSEAKPSPVLTSQKLSAEDLSLTG